MVFEDPQEPTLKIWWIISFFLAEIWGFFYILKVICRFSCALSGCTHLQVHALGKWEWPWKTTRNKSWKFNEHPISFSWDMKILTKLDTCTNNQTIKQSNKSKIHIRTKINGHYAVFVPFPFLRPTFVNLLHTSCSGEPLAHSCLSLTLSDGLLAQSRKVWHPNGHEALYIYIYIDWSKKNRRRDIDGPWVGDFPFQLKISILNSQFLEDIFSPPPHLSYFVVIYFF